MAHTLVSQGKCSKMGATSAGTSRCKALSGKYSLIARNAGVSSTASPKYRNWIARIFITASASAQAARKGLKGRHNTAQGNVLGKSTAKPQALKGRHNTSNPNRHHVQTSHAALPGLDLILDPVLPGRCPGLYYFAPLGHA